MLADAILKKADAGTCNELRKALQGYGLSIYGNKETLMRRLKSHHKIIKKSKSQPKSINKMAEKSDDIILEQKNVDYKKSFHCINCETVHKIYFLVFNISRLNILWHRNHIN